MEGPRAGRHIHEVIEEAIHSLRLQLVQQEAQSGLYACRDGCARLITALIADAECRQSESRCRDTRYPSRVVSRGERAVFYLPGRWICLLPEKKKTSLLDFLEQLVVSPFVAVPRR